MAELERLRDDNFGEGLRRNEELRQRAQDLSPEQRREFFLSSMPIFAPMMERRLK